MVQDGEVGLEHTVGYVLRHPTTDYRSAPTGASRRRHDDAQLARVSDVALAQHALLRERFGKSELERQEAISCACARASQRTSPTAPP